MNRTFDRECESHNIGGLILHQRLKPVAALAAATALIAIVCASALGAEGSRNAAARSESEPVVWQGPELTAQLVPPAPSASSTPNIAPLDAASPQPGTSNAGATAAGTSAPANKQTPLLDGQSPTEELALPDATTGTEEQSQRRGVQPYGGGHPTDWPWGCGGSPYRTGPGLCDDWTVGPRWHITVDGLVMTRESTDLNALWNQMMANDLTGTVVDPTANPLVGLTPELEQFDHGPGGRITFTSQVARCTAYDVQAAYEGINDWNASIVFPKQTFDNVALPIPPNTTGDATGIDTEPGGPFPQEFQQRSLSYRSDLNSGELNFIPGVDPACRPFFGARFIRFSDEIQDQLNQETQPPLPGPLTTSITPGPAPPGTPIAVNDPIGPTYETDRLNIFHLQNNLMGFQLGMLFDSVQLTDRLAFEGFVSGGVYYNRVKYSNVMGVFTTQTFADNTRSTGFNDARTDASNIINNDARDLSEISYEAEASLTAVCRLNRCWALRAGYQVLWINHLHLADEAFLGNPEADSDLIFHGWHAGIECRR
ncbi:MAG TPA: hypothetical protein VHE81_05505 [Lacipirellulaceae bacterium]|nr:hypothetical protein [Lacipirellulaceae bacterium]